MTKVTGGAEPRRLVAEEIEDPADVRMGDLPRQERLALEARNRAGILRDLRANRLQRHVLVQLAVLGLVELAHAAAGDEADDAEAVGDDLAVSECYGRGREHDAGMGRVFPR